MKNLIYLFLVLLFAAVSCSDDFTVVPAVGALSEENLANETGVDLLLTGAYSILNGTRNGGSAQQFATGVDNWWIECISDDAHKGSTDGDQATLLDLELLNINTANDYVRAKFQILYAGVNRANAVISLIETIEEGDFSAQAAEAYFLRGFNYFELTKIYGNVAIISTENFRNLEFNQPNPGPAWGQVESDLQFAIDNLPASQGGSGRPTRGTATAYLAKALLYQGRFAEALPLFNQVINSGEFALQPEFFNNFTAAGELSSEAVFSVQHLGDQGNSPNGNIGNLLSQPGGGPYNSCCGFFMPTIDLSNAFKTDENGLPLLETFNDSDITNDYNLASFLPDVMDANGDPIPTDFTPHQGPLDPRIDYTIGRRGIDFNGFGIHPGQAWIRTPASDISGIYLNKKTAFQIDEVATENGNGGWGQTHSGIDYNAMRYADVLLMAAEAAVETGDLGLALNYINQVRNRAVNMTYESDPFTGEDAANYVIAPYPSFDSQAQARMAVRHERRLELGMEGHRMFDLRRWGVAGQTITDYIQNESRTITNFGPKTSAYNPAFDLLPIPVSSIDLSGGSLTQNPGY